MPFLIVDSNMHPRCIAYHESSCPSQALPGLFLGRPSFCLFRFSSCLLLTHDGSLVLLRPGVFGTRLLLTCQALLGSESDGALTVFFFALPACSFRFFSRALSRWLPRVILRLELRYVGGRL